MSVPLETIPELIERYLPATGMNRTELAARLGIAPGSLSRWADRMPPPDLTRSLAEALGIPLGLVLAAALRSRGYASTTTDVLAGHTITIAPREVDAAAVIDDINAGQGAAAFTDPTEAAKWATIRADLDTRDGFANPGETFTVTIDDTPTPRHHTLYSTTWNHRADAITSTVSGYYSTPPLSHYDRASGRERVLVSLDELANSAKVFAVTATSLDPAAGHAAVAATVEKLRGEGRLLAADAPGPSLRAYAGRVAAAQHADPESLQAFMTRSEGTLRTDPSTASREPINCTTYEFPSATSTQEPK